MSSPLFNLSILSFFFSFSFFHSRIDYSTLSSEFWRSCIKQDSFFFSFFFFFYFSSLREEGGRLSESVGGQVKSRGDISSEICIGEREEEKEKGRSLVRFQFRAWTARWRKWRPRQRPRRLYRSSLSPFSLETLEFVSPPVEVNFLLPTRLLPSKRRFQPTMLPPRVVARQLASDLVRLGLNSQSRCVTRLVECPINQTTRFLVRFQMKISRGRTSLRVPAPFPIYISCTIIEAEGQWKKNRSLRRNRSRKNIRKERRGDKLVYNRPIDPSGTFRCSVVQ